MPGMWFRLLLAETPFASLPNQELPSRLGRDYAALRHRAVRPAADSAEEAEARGIRRQPPRRREGGTRHRAPPPRGLAAGGDGPELTQCAILAPRSGLA